MTTEFSDDEINEMMDNITNHRCKACNGLIDYHKGDTCHRHWKMEQDRKVIRQFVFGLAIGVCGTVLGLIALTQAST